MPGSALRAACTACLLLTAAACSPTLGAGYRSPEVVPSVDASNSSITAEVDNPTAQRMEVVYSGVSLGMVSAGGFASFPVPPTKLKLGNFAGVTSSGAVVRLKGSVVRNGESVRVYLRPNLRPKH